MDKIIEISYKGFSDSVISYMESYNYTIKCLEKIDNINFTLEKLTNVSVNNKKLKEDYESAAYLRRKNEICGTLADIVSMYEKYLGYVADRKYIDACSLARDIFDTIKKNELEIIVGVKYFLDELNESVRKVLEGIFKLLGLYVFHDTIENKKYFRCIEILNKLEDFDRYLSEVIEQECFSAIEDIIIEVGNKRTDDYNEYICGLYDKSSWIGDAEPILDMFEDFEQQRSDKTQVNEEKELDFFRNIQNEEDHSKEPSDSKVDACEMTNNHQTFINEIDIYKRVSFDDYRINLLSEEIVSRVRSIRYNVYQLKKESRRIFMGLDDGKEDKQSKHKNLQIFNSRKSDSIDEKILRVVKRFIFTYSNIKSDFIESKEFKISNIVDDLNYSSVYDEKYSIFKKITKTKPARVFKKDEFTIILKPDIKICLKMSKHLRDDEIQSKSEEFINSRSEELKKEFIFIFQSDGWDKNEYSTRKLSFFNDHKYIIEKCCSLINLLGKDLLDGSHVYIIQKFEEKYNAMFPIKIFRECEKYIKENYYEISPIIKLALTSECVEHITNTCITQSIDHGTLNLPRNIFYNLVFTINTLESINILKDARFLNLTRKYIHSLKIRIILDIMYFFDIFYREGVVTKTFYISKIGSVIDRVKGCVDVCEIFSVINNYCMRNIDRLKVQGKENKQIFVEKIVLLDEVLGELCSHGSLNDAIKFLKKRIENADVRKESC